MASTASKASTTSKWASRGATRIHYLDSGGSGIPVVFGHGFFMDSTMFEGQVAALGERFRCLAIDARGHGQTQSPSESYDYWDLAADALAVMDAAGAARAHLVGHSQGGFTALRMALTAPERVASLTLIASAAKANSEAEKLGYDELFGLWEAGSVPEPVLEQLGSQLIGDAELAKPWMRRWAAMPWSDLGPASGALRNRDDVSARLVEITVPVLLLAGSLDAAFPLAAQQEFAVGFGADEVTLLEVDGGAHAMNLTQPEAVNPALLEFLSRHGVRAGPVWAGTV